MYLIPKKIQQVIATRRASLGPWWRGRHAGGFLHGAVKCKCACKDCPANCATCCTPLTMVGSGFGGCFACLNTTIDMHLSDGPNCRFASSTFDVPDNGCINIQNDQFLCGYNNFWGNGTSTRPICASDLMGSSFSGWVTSACFVQFDPSSCLGGCTADIVLCKLTDSKSDCPQGTWKICRLAGAGTSGECTCAQLNTLPASDWQNGSFTVACV